MLARELIKDIALDRIPARFNRPVRGLAYDAASVLPGMAYFALRQGWRDGHDHVVEAVDRGAGLIVSERYGRVSPRVASVRVDDSRAALAHAAALFHGRPSRALRVVAVTGGEGLSGVAWFVRQFLALAGQPAGLIGTIEHHLGRHVLPSRAGCEEPLDIQRMLASLLREHIHTGVVELDEQAFAHGWASDLEINTLVELDSLNGSAGRPKLCARHRLALRYWAGADFFVSVRDADGQERCGLSVLSRQAGLDGWVCRVETPVGRRTLRLPIVGLDHLQTALTAAAVAVALGVPAGRLPGVCRRLRGIPGVREQVRSGQPFGVLVDGAGEPAELAGLLREARGLASGRLLLLLGANGSQDADARSRLGTLAAQHADFTFITANDPDLEPLAKLNEDVLLGALSVRSGSAEVEPDRARAIDRLVARAEAGDLVLLTGKGRRTTQRMECCIAPFDDRGHAARALEALGWSLDSEPQPRLTR